MTFMKYLKKAIEVIQLNKKTIHILSSKNIDLQTEKDNTEQKK